MDFFFKNTKSDDMCKLLCKFSMFNIEVSFQQMYLWMSECYMEMDLVN